MSRGIRDLRMLMKIGLVTGEYPPMQGGVGAFTQELAKALATLGHEIHIVTSTQARPPGSDRIGHDWRALRQPLDLDFAMLHPYIPHWRWPALATVADLVHRYDLDVVNIQYQAAAYDLRSPAANLLPWRLRGLARTVVTYHDLRVPYLFPKAGRLRQWLVFWMARQAHGVIATNPEDYQVLKGVGRGRLRQIPIGSNITVWTPTAGEIATVRETLGLAAGQRLIGYFGFLHPTKGADTLIQSLASLPDNVHLAFIGGRTGTSDAETNQTFLNEMQTQMNDLGLADRIHWTGFVPEAEVSAHLHAAELMVMPYRDGVSLRRGTLMAVLAHGRPLVTTPPATPTPELIDGQNAYFVPADDAAALAAAIGDLLADAGCRERLGQGAAAVAARFTWDKIAQQTAALYAELL